MEITKLIHLYCTVTRVKVYFWPVLLPRYADKIAND